MSWTFNPPPGWPPQPDGWVPPPGWAPDPRWPPAPAGWQFWVPTGGGAAPGGGTGVDAGAATGADAGPWAAGSPAPGQGGAYPPGQGGPDPQPPAAGSGRPWFARWWVIVGLIALLVIGSAIGFGGTRAAIELRSAGDSFDRGPELHQAFPTTTASTAERAGR